MNAIVFLVARGSAWSPEDWAIQHGGQRGVGGQVMIEGKFSWLPVLRDDRLMDEFDYGEHSQISRLLVEPASFLLEWKGDELIEALLRDVPIEIGAVVDNDHGLIVPVNAIRDLPLGEWTRTGQLPVS